MDDCHADRRWPGVKVVSHPVTWIDGRPEGTIPGTWSMTKNGAPSTVGSRSTQRARGTGTDG